MKKLIAVGAILTLAVVVLSPVAQAVVTHSEAHSSSATVKKATHHFNFSVGKMSLTELSIKLPQGINIGEGIEVENQLGEKIDAQVSINDRKATLVFAQPVPPETTLSVRMLGVNTPGYPQIWQYRFFGKLIGMNEEIPLGFARIQTYR